MRLAPKLLLGLALGFTAAVGLAHLADELPARAVELGATNLIEPDAELVELLRAADEPLHVTWFATDEAEAPAERRGFATAVAELLGRLQDAAPGKLEFARADPTADEDVARYAARRGVASFRAEGVRGDTSASHEVHATLLLERGLARPARLEHLGPEHLPILQALLLERLRESASPTRPRVRLVLPARAQGGAAGLDTFGALEAQLAARADLDSTSDPRWAEAPGPDGTLWADLTIWIGPEDATPSSAPAVARYLESGRALVVAAPAEAPALLAGLGLELGPRPPADHDADRDGTPDLVASIAPNQDFRLLDGQPDGSLLFDAPVSLRFDAAALDRRGASGRQLASSAELDGAPKRGLVALVDPVDPREGRLVVLGAATPFTDAGLAAPGAAHRRFVALLLDSFTGADRRVLLRAMPDPAERLGELSAGARWATRAWLWLPLPLLLVGLGLLRRRQVNPSAATLEAHPTSERPGAPRSKGRTRPPWLLPDPGLALGAVVALALAWLTAGARWPRLDWTAGQLATPSATLAEVAADLADEVPGGELHVELLFSRPGRLPVGLRDLERRTRALLDACGDAGLELFVERLEPELAEAEEREVLVARGLSPFHHDQAGARTSAWASLVLTAGSTEVVIEFSEAREAGELELRLALALERLRVGRAPRVGLATDLPRLSAAEDYEFQSRGSFAPREGDVFGLARRGLERAGFDVTHISPRTVDPRTAPTDGLDALVWLQPRRELRPMLDTLAGHLAAGGRALVAAQHFRTQARQYRGADFDQVFWPQPQLIDLERFYLPTLGVTLERQLVLDRITASLPIEARLAVGVDDTEFTTRLARQGFLVRVPTEQFTSPLLDGVTDLGLPDPSRIVLDEARLAELGIEAQPLLRGSADAWAVDWRGGWLSDAMLSGVPSESATDEPAADSASLAPEEVPPVPTPEPLFGVDLVGRFPAPAATWEDYAPFSAGVQPPPEPGPSGSRPQPDKPGRLVLLGASAFLTDSLLAGDYRGDALLLNLVADLALAEYGPHGPALAELARRRPSVPGFAPPEPRARALARVAVLGGGLAALVLAALLLRALRRTRSGLVLTAPAAATPGSTSASSPDRRTSFALRSMGTTLAGPAALALIAWLAAGSAAGFSSATNTGSLRFGRPVPPDLRARTLAALRVSRASRAGEEPSRFTYVHQSGLWRELEGIGGLGDGPAITALVEALFEAEGRVVHPGTGDLAGWDFEPETAWRIELFEAPASDDEVERPTDLLERLDTPYLSVQVGLQTREATDAWIRIGDDPAIWQVDRSPRPALDATWQPRASQDLPPLFDSGLVPRSWPGRNLGLEVVAWQRFGDKSKRLVRTAVERTPEQLRAGNPPLAWTLVGEGGRALLDGGEAGAGAEAYLGLLLKASASELLDPARSVEYGFGTDAPPAAILVVQTPASEELGQALGLNLEFGPPLPPALGGGRALVNGFTGNLVRVSEELFEALVAPAAAFGDAEWTRRWKALR